MSVVVVRHGDASPARPGLSRLPVAPVAYHQLLRGPWWSWWRAPVSLLCLAIAVGVMFLVVLGAGAGLDAVIPDRLVGSMDDDLGPLSSAVLDLALASLIPASMTAVALVHWRRPGWLTSVVGRLRWRWLLRCVVVVLPVFVVYVGLGTLLDPPTSGRPEHWVQLLVLTLVLTPLQAAGEEYAFRGWLMQNVGGYFRRPVLGLVVATVVSSSLFALAHGSLHPWVLLDLATFGAAAALVDWRSGGLEAGIAVHTVNNVVIGVASTAYGGYADSFVDTDTTGSPPSLATSVVVQTVVVALLWWQARRAGVVRLSPDRRPVEPPPLPDAVWIAPLGR